MKKFILFLILSVYSICAISQELFLETKTRNINDLITNYYSSEKFAETYFGTINLDALKSELINITIPGKQSVSFRLNRESNTFFGENGTNSITLTQDNDKIVGYIFIDNMSYEINSLDNNLGVITRTNSAVLREKEPVASFNMFSQNYNFRNTNLTSSPLRVLVFYANKARTRTSSIYAHAENAIATTNITYRNSNISHRVELAGVIPVNYNESNTTTIDLPRFLGKNDGYMDDIHSIRDVLCADVCVLIGCDYSGGIAGEAGGIMAGENLSFCVVDVTAASGNLSFPHEIGHIIGTRHDIGMDSNLSPFAYGHGYISPNKSWRTVMAYGDYCNYCERLPYWSNPRVNHPTDGIAMGTSSREDNARVLNEQMNRVKAFRNPTSSLTFNRSINSGEYYYIIAESEVITSGSVILSSNSRATIHAPSRVVLKPGFRASSGSNLNVAAVPLTTVQTNSIQNDQDFYEEYSYENKETNKLSLTYTNNGIVNYSVPNNSNITLFLINSMGIKVKDFISNKYIEKGEYQLSFDKNNLSKGTYFFVLSNGNERISSAVSIY